MSLLLLSLREKFSKGNSQQLALCQQFVLFHAAQAKESAVELGYYLQYSSANT